MRRADIYLRRGKIFSVGMKGTGGVFYEDSSPRMEDAANVGAVTEAIQAALEASVIPSALPPNLHQLRSALPALASVKNDSAFNRGAALCIVRESDDRRIDLLRGEIVTGGAWRAKVSETLAADTTPAQLAEAVLRVLAE
jgi:hypothetical protein